MKKICLHALPVFLFFTAVFCCNAQPSNWQARGVGGGGSMFYPSINPANDNEFYVTCDMSQLFHSTDFGASYTQVPFTKLQSGNIQPMSLPVTATTRIVLPMMAILIMA